MLSKTSGMAGEALRITELGLAMKSEIEKVARTGAEHRMSGIVYHHLGALRVRQEHADQPSC